MRRRNNCILKRDTLRGMSLSILYPEFCASYFRILCFVFCISQFRSYCARAPWGWEARSELEVTLEEKSSSKQQNIIPFFLELESHMSHVLLHLVKSSCPNSVNPFSTLFSADIQHNCPILFYVCRPYFPPWLAFRFSIKKWLHLHFRGKWPLLPSSFKQLSFSLRFALPINKAKLYQRRFRTLFWLGLVWLSLVYMQCSYPFRKQK